MASSSDIAVQPLGLRERKKARTRATIQQEALRLFREQGYAATTVDEIAAAAEVSQSTCFRYFPTKEDVVMYDALDALMIAAFRAQPPQLSPLAALRGARRRCARRCRRRSWSWSASATRWRRRSRSCGRGCCRR